VIYETVLNQISWIVSKQKFEQLWKDFWWYRTSGELCKSDTSLLIEVALKKAGLIESKVFVKNHARVGW